MRRFVVTGKTCLVLSLTVALQLLPEHSYGLTLCQETSGRNKDRVNATLASGCPRGQRKIGVATNTLSGWIGEDFTAQGGDCYAW